MNKEEAISLFIDTIYKSKFTLMLTDKEIKILNTFFKEVNEFEEDFDKYFKDKKLEFDYICKLKSGKYEMEKQYKLNKGLQSGILSECNFVETLSKIFKLNKCLDFDCTPLNKVPIECRSYLNSGHQTYSTARYLYYNPKNLDIFLFQYGNPADGDAEIIIFGNKIRLEFKERAAKAGEYDITGLYDEAGRLYISEKFRKQTPEYIPLIEKFNSETNMIKEIGHNYSTFDEEMKRTSIREYFFRHKIDVLISSTDDNELIALTPDCIDAKLSDGSDIILTDQSEIRSSGRNSHKIFTPLLWEETLNKMKAINIGNGQYQVDLNNPLVEIKKGRGMNAPSRVNFRNVFFVNIKNARIEDGKVNFYLSDVKQKVPCISMHITIKASKAELKEYYERKSEGV